MKIATWNINDPEKGRESIQPYAQQRATAEAIVRGLPVIGTSAGAIPDTVPETCGILVEPNNVAALTKAIDEMLKDPQVLADFKKGALDAGPSFPVWKESANEFFKVLEAHL